jgi:hypothetical protein
MIIDFNDVTPGRYGSIPDGYDRFHWHNIGVTSGVSGGPSGYHEVSDAGSLVGFNVSALPGWFASDRDFDLRAGDFAAAWNDGLHVKIVGFDDGVRVAVLKTVLDQEKTHIVFDSSFESIDKVRIISFGGTDADGVGGQGEHVAFEDLVVHMEPQGDLAV